MNGNKRSVHKKKSKQKIFPFCLFYGRIRKIFEYIGLIMPNNAILSYLDLVWRERNSPGDSFFGHNQSFSQEIPPSAISPILQTPQRVLSRHSSSSSGYLSGSPVNTDSPPHLDTDLPIHAILLELQRVEQDADAEFFAPFVLHYWQIQRLLDVLRCSTPVLACPAIQRNNAAKIQALELAITKERSPAKQSAMKQTVIELERENRALKTRFEVEKQAMIDGHRELEKDNIQSALVLARLLNIVFRKGMSVGLLSDQLRLEAQLAEYRELLSDCGIVFDRRFVNTFTLHPSVQSKGTVLERLGQELSEDIAWAFNDEGVPDPRTVNGALAIARYYVSRVLGIQLFHAFYNHLRLGGTRFRRLLAFLEPFLKNKVYSELFQKADPYMRSILAYVNWMFFVPRLSLNFSLLSYHGSGLGHLEQLERNLDLSVRVRAHWTRFWFEVIPDLYWFLLGLKVCFWLPGGALTPLGIALSVTIQALDLLTSIVRAAIELYRLYKMSSDLDLVNCPQSIRDHMDKRFWFEAQALGYMVCHFSILMVSLCLTLPSVGAVSTMFPVVGGVNAVLLTVVTYHMQNYFNKRREEEFELKPKPLPELSVGNNRNQSMQYQ